MNKPGNPKPNQNSFVNYEKVYTDDISINIPSLFANKDIYQININKYWENAIDGFYKFKCIQYFLCVEGHLRIVIAKPHESEENNYVFSQYFLSGMDGKIITILPDSLFCVHNLHNNVSILVCGKASQCEDFERVSYKIFNWNAKRP